MKIAIFGNIYREIILTHIELLFEHFKSGDVTFLLDNELFQYIKIQGKCCTDHTCTIEDDDFEADIVLSIGGDGTFLNTAARVGRKQIPIIGINIGRLGFLADISGENLIPAMEAILAKRYEIEERSLLYVEASDGTVFDYPYALNEVAVLKQDSSSLLTVHTRINGENVHSYQADGLLVSTPTGSTAYSLSVGGPIVVPSSQNFILSPIASHSLSVRPLIIPDNWAVELDVNSRSHCYLIAIDGRSQVLEEKTKLKITKADYSIKIIKQLNHTFFDTLKNKLMWGVDKRN